VDLCPRFLVPFLRSIFDPFLDFSWTRICLFYGTFLILGTVLDPFWDLFWTVHFIKIWALHRLLRVRICQKHYR
jgi:hypothetical protein